MSCLGFISTVSFRFSPKLRPDLLCLMVKVYNYVQFSHWIRCRNVLKMVWISTERSTLQIMMLIFYLRFLQLEVFGLLKRNTSNNTQIWICTSKHVSECTANCNGGWFLSPTNECRRLKPRLEEHVLGAMQRILCV
jgi:hypothetical protein